MNALKKKMNKNGGFTLIEMLIVVAIIAILIAVAIPLVNNALERAREATDAANVRSAKAELTINYLSDASYDTTTIRAFDAGKGSIEETTSVGNITPYGKSKDNKGLIIYVKMDGDDFQYIWKAKTDIPTDATTGWKSAVEIVD